MSITLYKNEEPALRESEPVECAHEKCAHGGLGLGEDPEDRVGEEVLRNLARRREEIRGVAASRVHLPEVERQPPHEREGGVLHPLRRRALDAEAENLHELRREVDARRVFLADGGEEGEDGADALRPNPLFDLRTKLLDGLVPVLARTEAAGRSGALFRHGTLRMPTMRRNLTPCLVHLDLRRQFKR